MQALSVRPKFNRMVKILNKDETWSEQPSYKFYNLLALTRTPGIAYSTRQKYSITHVPTGLAVKSKLQPTVAALLIEAIYHWYYWDKIFCKDDVPEGLCEKVNAELNKVIKQVA